MSCYRISRDAMADLDGIWEYIAERAGAETATDLLAKLYETFVSIASSPRAGVSVPDLGPPELRRFPMGNYLIYYRALRGRVVISRVLHGKRDQRKALRPKPPQ